MDPERSPGPTPPVTGTAPLPRTPFCGELAAWEPMLAGVAVRARVDLTVSGLKSDSPSRIGIAGSAPAGVRAQERAVCRNSQPTAAAGGTLDLLQVRTTGPDDRARLGTDG
jgi:hypothetical protein